MLKKYLPWSFAHSRSIWCGPARVAQIEHCRSAPLIRKTVKFRASPSTRSYGNLLAIIVADGGKLREEL